jgi:gentisate 1,2-dioxygenase
MPLWERLHMLVPPAPKPSCAPILWRYDTEVRPFVMESGSVITAEEAIRRVLILENPALPGTSKVTTSLYAGLQLILPGEVAPSHRHSQSALRFIIEGSGAYTAVDGERTIMHPGDFIITPPWTWHDHGNEGNDPVVWLDGLDLPIVELFDATFAENHPQASQPVLRPQGNSFARYGYNMLPVDYKPGFANAPSPVFNYPYARSREALHKLSQDRDIDPWDGVKLRYVNPATGSWAMPTIATFMQLLPAGFKGRATRRTDATVYVCAEGRGRARVGWEFYDFAARDIFVVPSWTTFALESGADTVLFSYSDRPGQEALGLLREERLPAA